MPRSRAGVAIAVALVVAALAVMLPVGPPAATSAEPLPIKIGYQAVASWLLFGARSLRLYEKAGLNASFLKFTAGAPMIAAAQSQSIDVAMVGTVPFLAGISQGVDWVAIGLDNEYPRAVGFVVRNDSGIKALSDFKGKTIAFFRGSTSHYAVLTVLRRTGIGLDQVKLLTMDPAQQVAAMINKQIDVSAIWEPWMQKMIHQANGTILAREADLGLYTGLGVYAVRRDWLAANRETMRRFITALTMAYDTLEKDPAVAIKAVTDEMGLKESWARAIYEQAPLPAIYRQTDPTYHYSLAAGTGFRTSLTDLATFLAAERVIPKEVDAAKVVDESVMKEVLAARQPSGK